MGSTMTTLTKVLMPSIDNTMSTCQQEDFKKGGEGIWVLLTQNMKPCVSCNECTNILNGFMKCSLFPAMGTTKKVGPH
jgi:hypothetical protein